MGKIKRYYLFNTGQAAELKTVLENATFYETETGADEPSSEITDSATQFTETSAEITDLPNVLDSKNEISTAEEGLDSLGVPVVIGLSCGTCSCNFDTVQDQRQHYRLDWHRYNLKRKALSIEPVNEETFFEMMDGLSSISGSDEDEPSASSDITLSKLVRKTNETIVLDEKSESKNNSNDVKTFWSTPKILFQTQAPKNDIISVYKCLFPFYSKFDAFSCSEALKYLTDLSSRKPMVAVVMISGGHFAAGIFKGDEDIAHKTFHSYTVRAKQGGSQGARDAKSGTSHPKSAGASLRRYNEQSFNQHVQELLSSWKEKLEKCELILYRAVSGNVKILFGAGDTPGLLNRKEVHVKQIPFPTKRPTYKEVKRVLSVVATVESTDIADLKKPKKSSSKPRNTNANKRSPRVPKTDSHTGVGVNANDPDEGRDSSTPEIPDSGPLEEQMEILDMRESLEEFGDSLTPEERNRKKNKKKVKVPEPVFTPPDVLLPLIASINSKNEDDAITFISTINTDEVGASNTFISDVVDAQQSTVLHLASKHNLCEVVWKLLQSGADPCLRDKQGKCPYNLASSKECRKVYMRFQAEYPDKYDYRKAQVPGPLTKEMEEEKAEKQKLLNKLKREKDKLKKQEKKEKQAETEEQQRFLNLSDREKRALAAERRLLGEAKKMGVVKPVLVRCFECATDITGKIPFEYNQNVFCTPKCLAVHRKKFPTPLSL